MSPPFVGLLHVVLTFCDLVCVVGRCIFRQICINNQCNNACLDTIILDVVMMMVTYCVYDILADCL